MKNLALHYFVFLVFSSCAPSDGRSDKQAVENAHYQAALAFLEQGQTDSAFRAFGLAKEIFVDNRDSVRAGYCLLQMAVMQSNEGDYYGGQETALEALSFFDATDPSHAQYLSAVYNNLGIATSSLRAYDQAIAFYDQAIQHSSDSLSTQTYLNNKARAFHSKGEYDKAISIYESIREDTDPQSVGYARLLTNLALARWRLDSHYHAAPHFLSALHMREKKRDLAGQGSSYMHLSDYYADRYPDSALHYAHKFYATAVAARHPDDRARALYRLVRLSPPDSAKHYFETYKQLTDSVHLARSSAKNQFALIRYEVEKNKAANLQLAHENAQRTYQVTRQRVWTGAVTLLAVVLLLGGRYGYKKRQQRLELESENRIRTHRLNTSKKIHDVVANGIYRVMAEIENRDEIDREGILDRLESMYEQSRNISYENDERTRAHQDDHERIAELLKSFATATTKIIIAGNAPELWSGFSTAAKTDIECVLQELMVNMRKHSQATDVVVRFEKTPDGQLHMLYSDNGVGLPDTFIEGNGLFNTGSRIERLHGQINFVSERGKGLKIEVKLPAAYENR